MQVVVFYLKVVLATFAYTTANYTTFYAMSTAEKRPHLGKKIERIREFRGIKQNTLAKALGISQQAVSRMESSEEVDEERLERVADALGVNVDAIKNFNEEATLNIIQNNYDNAQYNVNYQFNPIEKLTELYERLLQSEREKVELLKTLLEKR